MTYSFLLVNFNMFGLVDRCIAQIQANLRPGEDYEILIADNSTDPQFSIPVDFNIPAVTCVRIPHNNGWVDALNQILPLARAEFTVIMHPDVTLGEDCFGKLREYLQQHPQAGVVSPNLTYPDGSPNAIRLRFPSLGVELERLANICFHILTRCRPFRGEALWDHKSDAQVDMVMSVLMMFRTQTLKQIGLVEPNLWTYYANDWLCGKARQLGWTCHYLAGVHAVHWERHSPKALYSDADNSAYKRDPVPVSDRMCRDRFTFLRSFYPLPTCIAFRMLLTLEYCVHLLAQLKPGRRHRGATIRKHAATIKAAWA